MRVSFQIASACKMQDCDVRLTAEYTVLDSWSTSKRSDLLRRHTGGLKRVHLPACKTC